MPKQISPTADDPCPCPCGGGVRLGDCCGPLLAGAPAPSAEALMRSRFTAHVLGDADYLAASRCATANGGPAEVDDAPEPAICWLDLRILRTEGGAAADAEGLVEFIARYKHNGRAGRLHEVSRFRRQGAGWCYLDGVPGESAPARSAKTRGRASRG
jgi:SEC-C motif-containing protein